MRRVRPISRRRVGGGDGELGSQLDRTRLPSRADHRRSFLGHVKTAMPANPLAPRGPQRQHPKMLPDGAREKLLAVAKGPTSEAASPYGTPEAALGTLMLELDFLRAIT
jgi:hypothetical protein